MLTWNPLPNGSSSLSNYEKITVAVAILLQDWMTPLNDMDICHGSDFQFIFMHLMDSREGSRSSICLILYHCKAPCEMTAYIMDSRLKLGDKDYLEEPFTECAIYNRAIQQAEKSKLYTKLPTPHFVQEKKKTFYNVEVAGVTFWLGFVS